jgi:iron(III) transport system ATP-binding protein
VAGFAEPDAGEIFLGGRNITRVPPHRRNTGMVFQSYALWPHMTVLENVTFGLALRGRNRAERKREAMAALETVQLAALAERKPNQLSGGQQQRVALARALAIRPDALLLDEPLSNLDASLRLEMRGEIRRIHRETGLTILYVTHDQKEALSLADRVALMRDGRIVQLGSPREMYARPASHFAAAFLGEMNFVPGRYKGMVEGQARVETALGTLLAARPAENLADGAACEIAVRPEALEVVAGKVIRPANSVAATVADVAFLGEMEQLTLRAGELELKALQVPRMEAAWKTGEAVWVSFRAEAGSVFSVVSG